MSKRLFPSILALLLLVGATVSHCRTASAQSPKELGQACAAHQQCRSGRCDNRPGAGCVAQDGTGNSSEFCTTHQQCRSAYCIVAAGKIAGVCSGVNLPNGKACVTHQECASRRCDNRPTAGCVAQDGTANPNEFCTTHQQCRSGFCKIASGKIAGTCSAINQPVGQPCSTHQECSSGRCDNRAGGGCVVAKDGTGEANQFCTKHEQCRSGLCTVAAGKVAGTCSSYNRPLGSACSAHGECTSQRCDNRPNAGCVSRDGQGETGEFCTTHQQCRSSHCIVTNGLRGTCSPHDVPNGKACNVSTECASQNCVAHVCAAKGKTTQPTSACPGGKAFTGYTYVGQPGCVTQNRADHPSAYLSCDATGYYCCENAQGANTKCGKDRWTFTADCMSYCASMAGNCYVEPLVRDGVLYGCYRALSR